MDDIFIQFGQVLSAESDKKDEIRTHCKGLDSIARSLQACTQKIHESLSLLPSIRQQINAALPEIKQLFENLETGIEAGEYYKYKSLWQNYIRDFTMV
jgi:predicted nuclease with TOPRIM domain